MSVSHNGNPLVRQPWLYEFIYPERSVDALKVCVNILNKHLSSSDKPKIVEIGCGIGRVLDSLSKMGYAVSGVDISQPMIDYALSQHPYLRIIKGDMRDFDTGEAYDALLCVGSTFTYNLSNNDVHTTLANFRKHCKTGGIMILGILNASQFLGAEVFNERIETSVDEGDFHGTAISRHLLDRRKQSFRRVRTWKIEGYSEPVIDDAEFRLLFPLEIEGFLHQNGFSIIGMWDNTALQESDLSDRRLYVAARAI
ncbi:MAG: class I SAM-dependent DNA methyltransferase [Armatimonadota bacterium]